MARGKKKAGNKSRDKEMDGDDFGEGELLGGDQGAPPDDEFGEEVLLGGDQALPDAQDDSFDEEEEAFLNEGSAKQKLKNKQAASSKIS